MTRKSFLAVACTLAIASLAFIGAAFDVSAATHASNLTGITSGDLLSHLSPLLAAPLAVMRADLDALIARAGEKLALITDDTAPEQARSIQEEHEKLIAEIADKRAAIAKQEAEESSSAGGSPSPTPEAASAARAADILDMGTRAGMSREDIELAIRNNVAIETFRSQAFDHLAARSAQTQTSPGRVTVDEAETRRAAQIEALSYRLGAPLPEAGPSAAARGHMDDGLLAIACSAVGHRGIVRNAREAEEILTRAAHTTSDFPIILEGSINRTLETRYALAQPTYRRIARRRDFRDFRPHTSIKLGDFPMLSKVAEDGEIKYGTLAEGKETISVASYARAISVSRQLMINDDLGAIAEMLSSYGATVALFEEITFYSQALNAVLSDNKTVFHADHNNLAASGAAIDVASVSAGRAAMSKQKSLDGNPLLSNRANLILTGPDKITSAEMLVASITPATLASVNIFSGKMEPMETAQITGNTWYLLPNQELGSNYRWGYLEGYEAPRVRVENPFGRQGMAMSVEHDFGCGAIDFRYGYKNPGA